MTEMMKYPSLTKVRAADRTEICRWYRFLPSPITDRQKAVTDLVYDRFHALGGFTPEISKVIGWKG